MRRWARVKYTHAVTASVCKLCDHQIDSLVKLLSKYLNLNSKLVGHPHCRMQSSYHNSASSQKISSCTNLFHNKFYLLSHFHQNDSYFSLIYKTNRFSLTFVAMSAHNLLFFRLNIRLSTQSIRRKTKKRFTEKFSLTIIVWRKHNTVLSSKLPGAI